MPTELLEKVREAGNAKSGFDNVNLSPQPLSISPITGSRSSVIEAMVVNEFEDELLGAAGIPSAIEMRHRSPHFGHSFGGELYAGGYYTYMWAGVLTMTATPRSRKPVICSIQSLLPACSRTFSSGNSAPPWTYVAFRGRQPNTGPLIENGQM